MMRRYLIGIGLGILLLCSSGQFAHALDVPPAPSLDSPIVDTSGALSQNDITAIRDTISQSRAEKDYQIGVLVIPTLGSGEHLEGYSLKVARQWGIGTDAKDNGVLLLVVINDHKMRIEVGRGLEGDLTDVESSRIERNVMAPEFRKNAYGVGIKKAVESITAQVEGRTDPNAAAMATSRPSKNVDWTWIFFLGFWILPWIGSVLARSKSWWAGGVIGAGLGFGFAGLVGWALWALIGAGVITLLGFLFDFAVSKNYQRAVSRGASPTWWAGGTYWGGSSDHSDGGGFGGFGGGDFGGGGASGDW